MTGWMQHKQKVSALLLICAMSLQAGEQGKVAEDMGEDFLLFLSDWEDVQDGWLDPLDFTGEKWTELDEGQETENESN